MPHLRLSLLSFLRQKYYLKCQKLYILRNHIYNTEFSQNLYFVVLVLHCDIFKFNTNMVDLASISIALVDLFPNIRIKYFYLLFEISLFSLNQYL